jgi:hypothetical protein
MADIKLLNDTYSDAVLETDMHFEEAIDTVQKAGYRVYERVVVPAGLVRVYDENGDLFKEHSAADDEEVRQGVNYVARMRGRKMISEALKYGKFNITFNGRQYVAHDSNDILHSRERSLEDVLNTLTRRGREAKVTIDDATKEENELLKNEYEAKELKRELKRIQDAKDAASPNALKNSDVVYEHYQYDYTSKWKFYLVTDYNKKTAKLVPIGHSGGSRGPFGVGSDEVIPDANDKIQNELPVTKTISPLGKFVPIYFDDASRRWTSTGKWTGPMKESLEGPDFDLVNEYFNDQRRRVR